MLSNLNHTKLKLSIIVAAYNVAEFIEKCIVSCLQDGGGAGYEIIVVNDGSTDNTAEILKQLETKHPLLKVVNQPNSGLGAARNTGLKHSSGEYIWFIDGDDYLHENVLSGIVNKITTQDLDVLILNYAVVDENYKVLDQHQNKIDIDGIITGGAYYETHFSKSYTWMFVFKKAIFIGNGLAFKERINMQDSEILPKIMYHTKRLAYYDFVCYYYVQQANSFTNSANGAKRYKYFESIIAVGHSLQQFLHENDNPQIASGIEKKLQSLNHIIFNHLLYFKYDSQWLRKIIALLKANEFYPLKHQVSGKNKLLKAGLNHFPVFTKSIIDSVR